MAVDSRSVLTRAFDLVFGRPPDPEAAYKAQLARLHVEQRRLRRLRQDAEYEEGQNMKQLIRYCNAGKKNEVRMLATRMIHQLDYAHMNMAMEQQLDHIEAQLTQCKTQVATEQVLLAAIKTLDEWTMKVSPERMEQALTVFGRDRLLAQIKQEKMSETLGLQARMPDALVESLAAPAPASVESLIAKAEAMAKQQKEREAAARIELETLRNARLARLGADGPHIQDVTEEEEEGGGGEMVLISLEEEDAIMAEMTLEQRLSRLKQ